MLAWCGTSQSRSARVEAVGGDRLLGDRRQAGDGMAEHFLAGHAQVADGPVDEGPPST